MSQNILTNTTTPPLAGATAIGVLNLAADSLARWFCGAATPTASAAGLADLKGFVWHDTATNTLKVRDQADTTWIAVGYFDETGKTFTPHTNPAAICAADTGTANAYVTGPTPAWGAYATGGPLVAFVAAHANTAGACTVNVSGLGTKAVVRQDGTNPLAGDIPTSQLTVLIWNPSLGKFNLLTQRHTPPAFVKGVFSNLQATAPGGVQSVTITADMAVLQDSANNPYLAASISQTASLASSGAGGLDTGSVGPNTWYSTWLIWNGATLSSLCSLSATAPTLPGGYAFAARTGWVRTDGASNIMAFVQYGRRAQWISTGSGLPRMANGSTSGAWSAVSTTTYLPPTAGVIWFSAYKSPSGATLVAPNNSYSASYSTTNAAPMEMAANAGTSLGAMGSMVLETSAIYWASTDSTATLWAFGWEDNL